MCRIKSDDGAMNLIALRARRPTPKIASDETTNL
jgi:hypothetical protein